MELILIIGVTLSPVPMSMISYGLLVQIKK
jgi:hypothetical protein